MKSANSAGSRLIAVGLLLTLLGGLFFFCVLPVVRQFDDYSRRIAERESLLMQNRLLAARASVLLEERNSLREELSTRAGFLQGESSELIGAALQDRLKRITERNGASLTSTQALAAEEESGFRKLQLRVNMTADIGALQMILHDLETSSPLLFVDNLDLRVVSRLSVESQQSNSSLQVRFDLYGFTLPPGDKT